MRNTALLLLMLCMPAHSQSLGVGTQPTAQMLQAWDIDIRPDGAGLPGGRGSVSDGREVYVKRCLACHGVNGEGGPQDRLVGGRGTLTTKAPVKTIGSFWPYATTLFDYVRRAMPFDAPQTLSNEDVYAVVAYLLHLNEIVAGEAVMDANTLSKVVMPNQHGFFPSEQ